MADEVQNTKQDKAPERAPERAAENVQSNSAEQANDRMRQDGGLDKDGLKAINAMEQGQAGKALNPNGAEAYKTADFKNQTGYLNMETGSIEEVAAKKATTGVAGGSRGKGQEIGAGAGAGAGTDTGTGTGAGPGTDKGSDTRPKTEVKPEAKPEATTIAPDNSGPVKRDAQGRITEVHYPDGNSRKFGYDKDGHINKITMPDGKVLEPIHGVFQDKSLINSGNVNGIGNAPPGGDSRFFTPRTITNPRVEADGTITYKENGLDTKVKPDGTSQVQIGDTSVHKDAQDRVTKMEYKNGNAREFEYDGTKLSAIVENGRKSHIIAGEIHNEKGEGTGRRNAYVSPEGHFSYSESNGDFKSFSTSGTESTSKPGGSYIDKDDRGRVVRIGAGLGQQTNLDYDQNGKLSELRTPDGKEFKLHTSTDGSGKETKEFRAQDGSVMKDLQVGDDGTLKFQDKDGKLHTRFSNGNELVSSKTQAELDQRAKEINQNNGFLSSGSHLQKSLEDLNPADRLALNESYKKQFGTSLKDELKSESWNPVRGDTYKDAINSLNQAELLANINDRLKGPEAQKATEMVNDFNTKAKQSGVSADSINTTLDKATTEIQKSGSSDELLKSLEKTFGETVPSHETLAKRYGVKAEETKNADGTSGRKFYVDGLNGEKIPVLESKTDNPVEIEKQLKEWQSKKITEMESKFNITLSKDGEKSGYAGKQFDVRTPRIDELLGLEKGLNHSQPSTAVANDKPTMVQFPVKPVLGGSTLGWAQDFGDRQRVVFEPVNRDMKDLHRLTLHEFGHVAENSAAKRDTQSLQRYYSDLGYRKINATDEKGIAKDQWQFRDRDGHYYTQQAGEAPFGKWTRVNEQGQPLKADGTVAKSFFSQDAVRLTNQEMREKAAIKPTSTYFPNPREQVAESITEFRDNAATRRALQTSAPDVYQATKDFDQREIDSVHGKNRDGSSKLIRLPDASLAPNTDANRKIVSDAEKAPIGDNRANQINNPGPPPAAGPIRIPADLGLPPLTSPFMRRATSGTGSIPRW